MSSRRGFTSASRLVPCLLALAVTTGCAKRYEGSLKDDHVGAHAVKPTSAGHDVKRKPAPRPMAKAPPSPAAQQAQETREPCASSEQCAAELRAMLNDPSRSWIGKPQSVEEHLTGTRQFAYLALAKILKCPELAAGSKDIQAGAQVRAPAGRYPAATLEQIKDLDAHVLGELKKETAARCARSP